MWLTAERATQDTESSQNSNSKSKFTEETQSTDWNTSVVNKVLEQIYSGFHENNFWWFDQIGKNRRNRFLWKLILSKVQRNLKFEFLKFLELKLFTFPHECSQALHYITQPLILLNTVENSNTFNITNYLQKKRDVGALRKKCFEILEKSTEVLLRWNTF